MLFGSSKFLPVFQQIRQVGCWPCACPRHLICFKQWTADMILDIIVSAINLKCRERDTHNRRLQIIQNAKVMILQEVNEPILNMAVSKAATLLGAYDVSINDSIVWDHDYNGCIFSFMADVIFVSTTTHMCVQRFAEKSSVPVLCLKSRTHATLQALSTIMAIMEEMGTMQCVNVAYLGAPHPVLNSYLLLCPMLGANLKFKCCCNKTPVSPLLVHASEKLVSKSGTEVKQCSCKEELLNGASVIISGPTASKDDKVPEFKLSADDIGTGTRWIYFHTCPRGKEVDECLFYHCNSRTFTAFENMHFVAAALMAYALRGYKF